MLKSSDFVFDDKMWQENFNKSFKYKSNVTKMLNMHIFNIHV